MDTAYIDRWPKVGTRLQTDKQILKMFPKFKQRQFENIVIDDETWLHNFKPVRIQEMKYM